MMWAKPITEMLAEAGITSRQKPAQAQAHSFHGIPLVEHDQLKRETLSRFLTNLGVKGVGTLRRTRLPEPTKNPYPGHNLRCEFGELSILVGEDPLAGSKPEQNENTAITLTRNAYTELREGLRTSANRVVQLTAENTGLKQDKTTLHQENVSLNKELNAVLADNARLRNLLADAQNRLLVAKADVFLAEDKLKHQPNTYPESEIWE
jgi:hypothetical protein